MIGQLTLSQELTDCVVGEPKEITLRVTPTANADGTFSADVEEVMNYEAQPETPPEETMPPKAGPRMKGLSASAAKVVGGGSY